MRDRTISVAIESGTGIHYAGRVFQYDYGLKLIITGLEIDEDYPPHFQFSNDECGTVLLGEAEVDGGSYVVSIPDRILEAPKDFVCYVYMTGMGESGFETSFGYTDHIIQFNICPRQKPEQTQGGVQ